MSTGRPKDCNLTDSATLIAGTITNYLMVIGNIGATTNDNKMVMDEFILYIASLLASATQTLTNKTIDTSGNDIKDIADGNIKSDADIAWSKMLALTASRVPQVNADGEIEASGITTAVLAFLDATSSIQTQFNAKAAIDHAHVSPLRLTGTLGSVLNTYVSYATGTSISGQTNFNIAVSIPVEAAIVGVALRVSATLSHASSAAYYGGATQSIGSIAAAQNSKLEAFFNSNAASRLPSAETNIKITADSAATYTDSDGEVLAVVYYQFITPLGDVGP